jgi:hypothetical protein
MLMTLMTWFDRLQGVLALVRMDWLHFEHSDGACVGLLLDTGMGICIDRGSRTITMLNARV